MFLKSKQRPVLLVHAGDQHVGSTKAMLGTPQPLDDGGFYVPSKDQVWFWDCWVQMWREVAALKKRYKAKVVYVSGGDEGEGDHHGSTEIWFVSEADQDRAVEQMFEVAHPTVDEWIFIRSTEAHIGAHSAGTERRARHFASLGWNVWCDPKTPGIYSKWIYTGVHQGVKIQVKHQPQTRSNVPHLQDNAAARQAQYTWIDYAKAWVEPPDLAIWHHIHYRSKGWYQGVFCYTCPSWQLTTAWATRFKSSPRIEHPGGIAFLCEDGHWQPFELDYEPESSVAWAQ